MIPLRDDQPSFSTPFINYFLIALNFLIFLWELSIGAQSSGALNAFIAEFGVVPAYRSRPDRALLRQSGHRHSSFFYVYVLARQFFSRCRQHALPLDFW